MASRFGATRNMVCTHCGATYDAMRTGMTFAEVRNLIITIGWCTKKGHVKNGRRAGVLGYWHELKMGQWAQHLGLCEAGTPELPMAVAS